jgi:hypothetical protein
VKVCFQFTQVESSEAGKCCYKVQVVNGHRERDTDPVPAVCTIYGISMTDVLSNNLVYQWTPNQQLGPITGDGLWHDIGVMCVDEFSMLTTKQLLVSLKTNPDRRCARKRNQLKAVLRSILATAQRFAEL